MGELSTGDTLTVPTDGSPTVFERKSREKISPSQDDGVLLKNAERRNHKLLPQTHWCEYLCHEVIVGLLFLP